MVTQDRHTQYTLPRTKPQNMRSVEMRERIMSTIPLLQVRNALKIAVQHYR